MGIKVVTGGTTGLQDGTLVSSGNRLTFTGAGSVSAHVRCDDGYWSDDQAFTLEDVVGVLPLEVSFDGGSTWLDDADGPVCPEIEDVNFPVLFRQTAPAAVGETAREFSTPGDGGTYNAITALSTPTLTATVISSSQIDLSWTNVANEDASPGYTIERSLDGSSWSALTTKAANVTTHSDTGLSPSTRYYYRVKAEGSGRYSDSGWGTDDDTTSAPPPFVSDSFTGTDDTVITSHTGETGATWTAHPSFAASNSKIKSNRLYQTSTADQCAYASGTPGSADYSVKIVLRRIDATTNSNRSRAALGRMSTSALTFYGVDFNDDLDIVGSQTYLRLFKFVAGTFTQLGSLYNIALPQNTDTEIELRMAGTSIKAFVDGVERISATDSSISAAGKAGLWQLNSASAETASTGIHIDSLVAY